MWPGITFWSRTEMCSRCSHREAESPGEPPRPPLRGFEWLGGAAGLPVPARGSFRERGSKGACVSSTRAHTPREWGARLSKELTVPGTQGGHVLKPQVTTASSGLKRGREPPRLRGWPVDSRFPPRRPRCPALRTHPPDKLPLRPQPLGHRASTFRPAQPEDTGAGM